MKGVRDGKRVVVLLPSYYAHPLDAANDKGKRRKEEEREGGKRGGEREGG